MRPQADAPQATMRPAVHGRAGRLRPTGGRPTPTPLGDHTTGDALDRRTAGRAAYAPQATMPPQAERQSVRLAWSSRRADMVEPPTPHAPQATMRPHHRRPHHRRRSRPAGRPWSSRPTEPLAMCNRSTRLTYFPKATQKIYIILYLQLYLQAAQSRTNPGETAVLYGSACGRFTMRFK
jgi:hypothetical protein